MRLPKIDMKSVCHPYPETTMFGAVRMSAEKFPDAPAYDFMDKITTYREFIAEIELAAKAFISYGIKEDDAVTICMPNTPQAIICLYALNRIGAIANMVHPLSSQKNITFYLNFSDSRMILTLDQFYEKVKAACEEADDRPQVIVARIQEELPLVKGFIYKNFKNKESLKYPDDKRDIAWKDFLEGGKNASLTPVKYDKDKTSVILYSGGTSGTPKGIQLTDFNFNALGMQIAEICGCNLTYGCKFLSVMPIFHGFGLGIGIHTILENGAMCILIPQFTKESYAEVVLKKKPNFIAGVPTLFEALLRVDTFRDADLSFLIGVFSGGDALNPELKKKVDLFFREHNAQLQIREGYGLTECVTASCVTPVDKAKTGSIGLPLRDMEYKIVTPGTFEELPTGEKGEIIIAGPTLMKGYKNNEEETINTIREDESGKSWLFTGDLGSMDEEGFVYFHQRIKRMIITSGYNVYPSHIERILDFHPDIDCSCVIGMPDPYKMQKIRAYISLNEGIEETEEEKNKILEYCSAYLDAYEMPQDIVFRREMPKTLVGKVSYHTLEKEAYAEADVLFSVIRELLGIDSIDSMESFINLGGNSLKALELKDLLEEKGYDIKLSKIFNSTDIQSINNSLVALEKKEKRAEYSSRMNITNAQQRIYTAGMLSPESTMYNITFAIKVDKLNPSKLEKAINSLIARHESLRTRFEIRDGQIMQIIDDEASLRLERLSENNLFSIVRPFSLDKSPLIRAGYCKNTIVVDMHHIISDGGALPVFFRELNELYMGRALKKAVQYGEFVVSDSYTEENEKYWLSVFGEEIPELKLPLDFQRKERQMFDGSSFYDAVDIGLHNRIIAKCRELNITPYVFYMACFNILLAAFSGSEDIVTGIPVTGRSSRFINTIGMFVNTLALRNRPEGTKTVAEFIDEVKKNSVDALDNQSYPFGELVKKLNISASDRNPLFDVMFSYQREEMTDITFGDKKAEVLKVPAAFSKYDFTFNLMPRDEDVVVMVEYCTSLFTEKTIKRFVDAYKRVLSQCLCEKVYIRDINVMTETEKNKLLYDFNNTEHTYIDAESQTLYSLFEKTAENNPDKICIRTEEKSVSFSDIKSIAEALECKISKITEKRKSVIAVIAERSLEMYGAVYGIIRGGNAYLPIDPSYPQERIDYILKNSSASAVVAQGKFMPLVKEIPCINMTEIINNPLCDTVGEALASTDDTAYVIYTSGSTGNPKGAKITHRSAINRILWMHDKYPLCMDDVILQKTPYTFDVSVWELFWWGITGGGLYAMKPGEHFIPDSILNDVCLNKITHLHFVPSVFEVFISYLEKKPEEAEKFSTVKYVFLSGEALSATLVKRFYAIFDYKNVSLHNLYGPTECAVDVTYYDCTPEDTEIIPIGKPIYNTGMYVVDRFMKLQPIGVEGELCIAGVNVGQGYIGNEELTAEKFIKNPFGEGMLYKTGDIAYFREDGNIIFVGRNDFQIKVRGLRIELGEIENAISSVDGVSQCAVIVREYKDNTQLICAYYTGEELSVGTVREKTAELLPTYMLPQSISHLEKMPLTTSGKINRAALTAIELVLSENSHYEAPLNDNERAVCDVFSRVLGIKKVSRKDNFFELGGTSLQTVSVLSEKLFEGLSVAEFMNSPTPEALACKLSNAPQSRYSFLEVLYENEKTDNVLILLPFAGGGAEAFSETVKEIRRTEKDTSVYFIRYLHSDLECISAAKEIEEVFRDKKITVYSHCVGAAVALKILDTLGRNKVNVRHYYAGAIVPVYTADGKNIWRSVPDSAIKLILGKAGAGLDSLSQEKQKEIITAFRQDTDFSSAVFSDFRNAISIPVTVILSKKDIFTKNYRKAEKCWSAYADNISDISFIDTKSHYFQSDNASELVKIIFGK